MRALAFILSALLLLGTLSFNAPETDAALPGDIIINEILYDPDGPEVEGE